MFKIFDQVEEASFLNSLQLWTCTRICLIYSCKLYHQLVFAAVKILWKGFLYYEINASVEDYLFQ